MNVLHGKCAGLDVHKETVVACLRIADDEGARHETRTFSANVSGLLALSEWLSENGCTHVAMEATGIYWKPVWYVLEGAFELVLANAAHVKNVPGRKTDVKDAQWLGDLLAHGLIEASFVPPRPIQHLRDYTRTRKQLVQEMTRHTQRIQKVLETANLKLSSVLSDVLGKTGRAVLEALTRGEQDPKKLLALKDRRVAASDKEFLEALRGVATPHHQFMLRLHLDQIDSLQRAIDLVDRQLQEALAPFRPKVELLDTIPGVSNVTSSAILAEIGTDMSRFPTSAHLVSWAGLCPGNDESAGKRRSRRLRKSSPWLKPMLVQAAWAAVKKKDLYPRAQFNRLRARKGPKKAIIAVAASLLTAAYHILRTGQPYVDLGPAHFDQRTKARTVSSLVNRLQQLAFNVNLQPAPAA